MKTFEESVPFLFSFTWWIPMSKHRIRYFSGFPTFVMLMGNRFEAMFLVSNKGNRKKIQKVIFDQNSWVPN